MSEAEGPEGRAEPEDPPGTGGLLGPEAAEGADDVEGPPEDPCADFLKRAGRAGRSERIGGIDM